LDTVKKMCHQASLAAKEADSKREPLAVLNAFPKDDGKTRQNYLELMKTFDGTTVRLGESPHAVEQRFGPPREITQHNDAVVYIWGAHKKLGWYPNPEVLVWFRGDKAQRVITKYLSGEWR
jgi:hypothetical protein